MLRRVPVTGGGVALAGRGRELDLRCHVGWRLARAHAEAGDVGAAGEAALRLVRGCHGALEARAGELPRGRAAAWAHSAAVALAGGVPVGGEAGGG